MSDRIVLMRAGRIEQTGAPRDLFESPETVFAARFMGVENIMTGTLEATDGERCTVRVGAARIEGRPVGAARVAAPGARVFAAVRAENTQLGAPGGLAGRAGATVYKGKYRDVHLETEAGPMVARLWDADAPVPADTRLGWAARHCAVGLLQQDDAA